MSLILILLLSLALVELGLSLWEIIMSNLLHIHLRGRNLLGSLHVLEMDVGLLGFLHHLLDLLRAEIHLRWRVLVLGLEDLLTRHSIGALLHDFLLR